MVDEEQLEILRKKGVRGWNDWRKQNPGLEISFGGANLSGANLSKANFSRAYLSGAYLSGTDLSISDFSGANLSRTDFSSAHLIKSNLSEANLTGANLREAYLSHAQLMKANLSEANLSRVTCGAANLSESNLSGANLSEAYLSCANLSGANLKGANLSGADLGGANLSGAKLGGANLTDANLSVTNLSGADLSGVHLSGVDFSGADLRKANLSYGNLYQTDLSDANLTGADLSVANLSGANLSRANLTDANLTNAYLNYADLSDANLSEADLRQANLGGANLIRTNLSGANLGRATLTGACLKNWQINDRTVVYTAICDYFYLEQGERERRPARDNFASGEFVDFVAKSIETVELIFTNPVEWNALFLSLQDLRFDYGEENVSLQAIESKSDGRLVIRLSVPTNLDKAERESLVFFSYENYLEAIKEAPEDVQLLGEGEKIEVSQQQNGDLFGVLELAIVSKHQQTLAEAAAELEQLLKQIEQSNPDTTEEEKVSYLNEKTSLDFRTVVVDALNAVGANGMEEFFQNSHLDIVKDAVKSWSDSGAG